MEPAGEMWSVVTESPSTASTRAPWMSASAPGAFGMASKNGGFRTYVDVSSQTVRPALRAPASACQRASPSKTSPYAFWNCSGLHGLRHRGADFLGRRPDVRQEDGLAVLAGAERLLREIDVHPARERVRDDERRRREVVHLDLRVDAPLEVAVSREHGRRDEVARAHGLGDGFRQRARVADARRAAVARRGGSRGRRGPASAPASFR